MKFGYVLEMEIHELVGNRTRDVGSYREGGH